MPERQLDIIPADVAGTLAGLFRERVRRTPDLVAYRNYDKSADQWYDVTWADMAARVARWQAALERESLAGGDRVALCLRNGKEWVAFDQAALGLGLVVVPLYPDDRPDNAAYVVQDSGARVLLLHDAAQYRRMADGLRDLDQLQRIVLVDEHAEGLPDDSRITTVGQWLPADGGQPRAADSAPTELASIVYTSGTTGRPKGVMLSHDNMLAIAHRSLNVVQCYTDDILLSFLPLAHTLERTGGYYLPMMAGSTVAHARSIPQLAEDLQHVRPTKLIAVPRIFERVYSRLRQQLARRPWYARRLFDLTVTVGWRRFQVQQGQARPDPLLWLWPVCERLVARNVMERMGGRMEMAVSGGAALPPQVARVFIGLGLPILQGYGLTETSPVVSVNRPESNDPASVGEPLEDVEVTLGEDDELLVRGPGVMMGYWNLPDATRERIDDEGWLHTGDQARIDDGRIYITGRTKEILVLSNGEKVPPGDMESAIALEPAFDQVMVVGEGRAYLAAVIVLNSDTWPELAQELGLDPEASDSLDDRRLKRHVLNRITELLKDFPGYAKVRRVALTLEPWTVENDLLTPTMKVKREAVAEHMRDAIAAMYQGW